MWLPKTRPKSAAPLSAPRRVKPICFNILDLRDLNTLGEGRGTKNRNFPWACWRHVGSIFRSWALLGRILRFSVAFSSLLGVFFASCTSRNSILEGLEAPKPWFGRPKCHVFFRFSTQAQPKALNATKPQFLLCVPPMFEILRLQAQHRQKHARLAREPFEQSFPQKSC